MYATIIFITNIYFVPTCSLENITRGSIESLRSELNLLKHFYHQKSLEMDEIINELQSKFSIQFHQLVKVLYFSY